MLEMKTSISQTKKSVECLGNRQGKSKERVSGAKRSMETLEYADRIKAKRKGELNRLNKTFWLNVKEILLSLWPRRHTELG